MGHLDRIIGVAAGTVANTVLALIYVRVGLPIADLASEQGSAMEPVISLLEIVPAVVIGAIYFGLLAVLLIGPVQEETASTRETGVRRR